MGRLNKTVHSSRKLYCFQMDTSFLSAALRQRRDAGGPTSCHHATNVWIKIINSTPAVIWAVRLYYSEISIYMWSDVYALILIAVLEESLLVLLVLNMSDMKTLSIMLLISYCLWARHKWYLWLAEKCFVTFLSD